MFVCLFPFVLLPVVVLTRDGGATSSIDFVHDSDPARFSVSSETEGEVEILIIPDDLQEDDETFQVYFGEDQQWEGIIINQLSSSVEVLIIDDDTMGKISILVAKITTSRVPHNLFPLSCTPVHMPHLMHPPSCTILNVSLSTHSLSCKYFIPPPPSFIPFLYHISCFPLHVTLCHIHLSMMCPFHVPLLHVMCHHVSPSHVPLSCNRLLSCIYHCFFSSVVCECYQDHNRRILTASQHPILDKQTSR